MTSTELENLVRIGSLKREPSSPQEIEGLRRSGEARLADAGNPSLSLESRFDLGYNAARRYRPSPAACSRNAMRSATPVNTRANSKSTSPC